MAGAGHHRTPQWRDHGNPAASATDRRRNRKGHVSRLELPELQPLPVRFNTCPHPACGHSNVSVDRVERCALCGTAIPPPHKLFAVGNQMPWKKREKSKP